MAGEENNESIGPMPAPVATSRTELKRGVKVRKLAVGGVRMYMCVGGCAMTSLVQSPAAEMMMSALKPSRDGTVAKACHSSSGERLKRAVEVYGMLANGKVSLMSREEMGVARMGTRYMRSQGRMMRKVVAARSQSEGLVYRGLLGLSSWVRMPVLVQRRARANQPPKRWERSKELWRRSRRRGMAMRQMTKRERRKI